MIWPRTESCWARVFGTDLRATRPDRVLDADVARPRRPFGVPLQAQKVIELRPDCITVTWALYS